MLLEFVKAVAVEGSGMSFSVERQSKYFPNSLGTEKDDSHSVKLYPLGFVRFVASLLLDSGADVNCQDSHLGTCVCVLVHL